MKKINLKNLNLKEVEQLSREQLKDVLGGYSEDVSAFAPRCHTDKCDYEAGGGQGSVEGRCQTNSTGSCVCAGAGSSTVHTGCKN